MFLETHCRDSNFILMYRQRQCNSRLFQLIEFSGLLNIYSHLISKSFLKLLTIKINGKTRRFDRASVIIK